MLDKKVVELLNAQVNEEFYSSYLYYHFSNFYVDRNLAGFANWYFVQAQEEKDHAVAFVKYLQENGESVELDAIEKPKNDLKNIDDPLVEAAKHERHITALINKIYDAADKARDFRTMQFLNGFIKEQMEEEATADNLVEQYKLFGEDKTALFGLDRELQGRAYVQVDFSKEG